MSELDTKLSELVGENSALERYVDSEDQQSAVQLSISVLSAANSYQDVNNTIVSSREGGGGGGGEEEDFQQL